MPKLFKKFAPSKIPAVIGYGGAVALLLAVIAPQGLLLLSATLFVAVALFALGDALDQRPIYGMHIYKDVKLNIKTVVYWLLALAALAAFYALSQVNHLLSTPDAMRTHDIDLRWLLLLPVLHIVAASEKLRIQLLIFYTILCIVALLYHFSIPLTYKLVQMAANAHVYKLTFILPVLLPTLACLFCLFMLRNKINTWQRDSWFVLLSLQIIMYFAKSVQTWSETQQAIAYALCYIACIVMAVMASSRAMFVAYLLLLQWLVAGQVAQVMSSTAEGGAYLSISAAVFFLLLPIGYVLYRRLMGLGTLDNPHWA